MIEMETPEQRHEKGEILPKEVILHIFSFLPKEDLLKQAGLVCKHWARLSMDPELWHEVSLAHGYVKEERAVELVQGMTQLKTLELCRWWKQDVAEIIGVATTQLEVLRLDMCEIQQETLENLVRNCKDLKEVLMRNCELKDCTKHPLDVFAQCPKLEAFHLIEVTGAKPIDHKVQRDWRKLKAVSLQTDVPSSDAEVKVLTDCVGSQLQSLTAKRLLVPRSYTRMGNCGGLQELHLIKNMGMTDNCLLSGLGKLTSLQGLTIRTGHYLTTEALLSFLSRPGVFQNLRRLDLSHSPGLDDQCLSAIADFCPDLKHLTVSYCSGFTQNGIENLLSRLQLQQLNAKSCRGLEMKHAMKVIKEIAPQLRVNWD